MGKWGGLGVRGLADSASGIRHPVPPGFNGVGEGARDRRSNQLNANTRPLCGETVIPRGHPSGVYKATHVGPLCGETAFPRGHPSGVYRNVSCTHVGPPCWWDTAAFVYRAPLPPHGVPPAIELAGCTAGLRPHEPETPWRVPEFMPG